MGHVFKHTYTTKGKDGRRVTRETKKWYIEWTDPHGKRHREPGYADRKATEHLLAERERDAARIASGLLTPNIDLVRQPLADHLAEYLAHLEAKQDTEEHRKLVESRCRKILDGCKFSQWNQLDAHRLEVFLAGLRAKPRGKRKGLAARTSNHYLSQFRAFVEWLAVRINASNPLASLDPLNADTDLRHVRRALTDEDFIRLIQTAETSSVTRFRQPGPDRAMLYTVAAYTGLRAQELASLDRASLRLEGDPPHLTVEAKRSKRRKLDTLPLQPTLVIRLTVWLEGRPEGRKLWPGKWASSHRGADMLRGDLEKAKIPYQDEQGRVFDFHALRGQYATSLARAGVGITDAQQLLRHSTPTLTAKHYTHLELADLAKAAGRLPAPPQAAEG